MSFYELNWRNGAKCVKLVVWCSLLVDVSVHGGMLTMAGSWWGKKVITPIFLVRIEPTLIMVNRESKDAFQLAVLRCRNY
jgi:hypothetical protein